MELSTQRCRAFFALVVGAAFALSLAGAALPLTGAGTALPLAGGGAALPLAGDGAALPLPGLILPLTAAAAVLPLTAAAAGPKHATNSSKSTFPSPSVSAESNTCAPCHAKPSLRSIVLSSPRSMPPEPSRSKASKAARSRVPQLSCSGCTSALNSAKDTLPSPSMSQRSNIRSASPGGAPSARIAWRISCLSMLPSPSRSKLAKTVRSSSCTAGGSGFEAAVVADGPPRPPLSLCWPFLLLLVPLAPPDEAENAAANGVATKTDAAAAACRHTRRPWLKSRSSTSDRGSGATETPTPLTHLFVSTLSAVRRFEGLGSSSDRITALASDETAFQRSGKAENDHLPFSTRTIVSSQSPLDAGSKAGYAPSREKSTQPSEKRSAVSV
mmetsp:Transcript_20343/g.48192  ORF Transcript_20343/g.48192 Transcript_20343/m.48192 type:complete len:385 (+) Transcript_20343:63-1217(+)|eukprot:scaffold61712_cov69-Phaeocystis_antarctica.AAC.6